MPMRHFILVVDDLDDHVRIDVPASMTNGDEVGTIANGTLQDLIDDINLRISRSPAAGRVLASLAGDSVALSGTSVATNSRLAITAASDNPAVTQLRLPTSATALPSSLIAMSTIFTGLTIDNPSDVDHYGFSVIQDRGHCHRRRQFERERWNVAVVVCQECGHDADTTVAKRRSLFVARGIGLRAAESNRMRFQLCTKSPSTWPTARIPVVVDYASATPFERQDVIFGGPGNDVLQGGPGEDFHLWWFR